MRSTPPAPGRRPRWGRPVRIGGTFAALLALCFTLTAQSIGGDGGSAEPKTTPVSKTEVKAWNKALTTDFSRKDTNILGSWKNSRRNAEGKRLTYTTTLVSIGGQEPAIGERALKGWTSALFDLVDKPEQLTLTTSDGKASVKIAPTFKGKLTIWSVLVDDTNARFRELHNTPKLTQLQAYSANGLAGDERYSFIMIGPKDGTRPSLALHVLADASELCQGYLGAKIEGNLDKFDKGAIILKTGPAATYCNAFAAAALQAARGMSYDEYVQTFRGRTANSIVGVRYIIFTKRTYTKLASAARAGGIGPDGLDKLR